tara:strand:+ start:368 stop:601 length:234 start_codon:yes stop_codon:yes gene_type:complete
MKYFLDYRSKNYKLLSVMCERWEMTGYLLSSFEYLDCSEDDLKKLNNLGFITLMDGYAFLEEEGYVAYREAHERLIG